MGTTLGTSPLEHGLFGLDEYMHHVVQALRELGPGTHVVAVSSNG